MKKDTKPNEGFLNESGLKFKDISSEVERTYTFPNGRTYFIKEPLMLHVSSSGGHRLFDNEGYSHYVQPAQGWAIKWKVREGAPDFVA